MAILVAFFLGMLGFYDNLSLAGAAEDPANRSISIKQQAVAANSKDTTDSLSPIAQKSTREDTIVDRIALVDKVAKAEQRIKSDIKELETLPNGLKLYSYKYRKDPNTYVGLLATDLAANEAFRHYVVDMGDGFYTINYPALKLHQATLEEYKRLGLAALKEKQKQTSSKAATN
jgi:hypothetical protein